MRLKYVLKRPTSRDSEVLVERETPEYPVPSTGDRVCADGKFYRVWCVLHGFGVEGDAFDDLDEVHALVAPLDEAAEFIDRRPTG